jgi:hypothetical protein
MFLSLYGSSFFGALCIFIHPWLYSPLLGPGLFFSFAFFFTQTARFLGLVTSPSQGRYLHAGQHRHRIKAHTNIHVSSGIRTHELRFQASEDSSCLRPCGHTERLPLCIELSNIYVSSFSSHSSGLSMARIVQTLFMAV